MKNEMKSLITYLVFGVIIGVVSFYLKNSIFSLLVMVGVLFALYGVMKKALKSDEKLKWFLTNGGWLYIFIWFISWTIIYNVI